MNRTSTRPSSNSNSNLGFLAGSASSRVPRAPQRRKVARSLPNSANAIISSNSFQNKSMQQGIQEKVSGNKNGIGSGGMMANMMLNKSNQFTQEQIQPGVVAGKISLPPDAQEKMNKWRENRELRLRQSQQVQSNHLYPIQEVMESTEEQEQENEEDNGRNYDHSGGNSMVYQRDNNDHQNYVSPQPFQPQTFPTSVKTSKQFQVAPPSQSPSSLPSSSSSSSHSPSQSQSLFDATTQDILKTMVSHEVRQILDQLKKERPELVNQADIMNNLNQKTRAFEDKLQEFKIQEQRLFDKVENLAINVKAVQTNVDDVKQESGGAGITEEVMRSWVLHFFNEQIGVLKRDIQDDINKVSDKISNVGAGGNVPGTLTKDMRTIESNLKLLENKFQNTLQTIYESVLFVYGSVIESEVNIYEKPDVQSNCITSVPRDTRLLLFYPITKDEKSKWMKVRLVDKDSAELCEGWVPVMYENTVFVANFEI